MKKVKYEPKPWERQEDETAKAFEAFSEYLHMGRDRTHDAVAAKLGKSTTIISRWSSKHNWKERIREYNNYIEQEALEQAIAEKKNMVKRHIKIATELQEKAMDAFRKFPISKMMPKDIKELLKLSTELERLNRNIEAGLGEDGSSSGENTSGTGMQVVIINDTFEEDDDEQDDQDQ